MSDLTVPIYFYWQQASADPRQFNQQRTLLSPDAQVAVDVPLKGMYIYNAEEILQAQIASEGKIKPVLTPLGMVYADNVLRAAYSTLEGHEDEDELPDDKEIDWEGDFDGGLRFAHVYGDEDKIVIEKLGDDSEFPVEELIDGDDDELDEILWEN